MTASDPDIGRLAQLAGLGRLPYRSFHNPPVRRAPPGSSPTEDAPPAGATVLTLSPAQGDSAPVLRVIAGLGGPTAPARPTPAAHPVAESLPDAAPQPPPVFASPSPAVSPPTSLLPPASPSPPTSPWPPAPPAPPAAAQPAGFSLLAHALGEAPPPPPAAPAATPGAPAAARTRFPLLDAALSNGGAPSWR
ncbi:hypothetical protein JYK14_21220 [Siccirubricoccus sp. KC 17139]|uniref:Uncharacterized protein n=1 Tax=Siccirubricoccus soli TaxID=2899147 RepID=A0ABT1D9Q2_9PROT|nr:hypothetical protein [Siccirubricoccus soli]MCO6418657.1 hypothetical protein [Siccirubricoccus soli]MCP2684792.1 hypothetical protein [Siccirubricoccus soli]